MIFTEFIQLYIKNSKTETKSKPIRPICNAPLGIKNSKTETKSKPIRHICNAPLGIIIKLLT